MSLFKFLSRQASDMVIYFIVPLISLLVPASFSRRLLTKLCVWQWLLREDADEACSRAGEYTSIRDKGIWKRRWRLLQLLDARDLCLLQWGRKEAVFSEISGLEKIELTRDRIMVGMHWGPSTPLLGLLQHRGLKPLFVYRRVNKSIFRERPLHYFFLTGLVRYIRRTCGERAIAVGGAGRTLARELGRPGTSVVLFDAPPTAGRSTIDGTVLGKPVKFSAGFPDILHQSDREYLFYALSLQAGDEGLRSFECTTPAIPGSHQQFIQDYCDYLGTHIDSDSAQWRFWPVAGQLFQTGNDS